jgi:hypothetical protein
VSKAQLYQILHRDTDCGPKSTRGGASLPPHSVEFSMPLMERSFAALKAGGTDSVPCKLVVQHLLGRKLMDNWTSMCVCVCVCVCVCMCGEKSTGRSRAHS